MTRNTLFGDGRAMSEFTPRAEAASHMFFTPRAEAASHMFFTPRAEAASHMFFGG
jgi:hypothetical protein